MLINPYRNGDNPDQPICADPMIETSPLPKTRSLVRATGLYDALCPTTLHGHMVALYFTRRYTDQVYEGNTASLGEAAMRQALAMVQLGKNKYRDFLEQHDIFSRQPTEDEKEQERQFLSLQVNHFHAKTTEWNLPDNGEGLEQFDAENPSLALWCIVKNNLLKSSTAFNYDDSMDLRTNLYRAEINLFIKDSAQQLRNKLDCTLNI